MISSKSCQNEENTRTIKRLEIPGMLCCADTS